MRKSAGLLLFRRSPSPGAIEVFLVHPGGPYFAHKDEGYWSIPKGLVEAGEPDLDAARREFTEETSIAIDSSTEFLDLGEVSLKSRKLVRAWAFEGDCDPSAVESNTFETQWPPKSGRMATFPEIDRAAWFGIEDARRYMNAEQFAFVERLVALVS